MEAKLKMDLYFTEAGDIEVSPQGDLAVTQTEWRDDVQQVYVRIMTDQGDWVLNPTLGADLSRLYGLPQNPDTGNIGVQMIQKALEREQRFLGKSIKINAVPTGYQTIRFDVYVTSGSREKIKLSVEQNLTLGEGS
jgi:hypothetical protein